MKIILRILIGYMALALIVSAPVVHPEPPADPMRRRCYWSRCFSKRRWKEHDRSFTPINFN